MIGGQLFGFQFSGIAPQPFRQLVWISKHTSALAAGYAVHRQSALSLPALHGALGSVQEDCNLLPRDESLLRLFGFTNKGSHGRLSFGARLGVAVYAKSYGCLIRVSSEFF